MNRTTDAHALLPQIVRELEVDIVLISEQYKNPDSPLWIADLSNRAAIWIINRKKVQIKDKGQGNGFAWIVSDNVLYVSCYISPNNTVAEYQRCLDDIEDFLQEYTAKSLIIGGDFNARSTVWSMPTTNRRGKAIIEMATRIGLVVANLGSTTTYRRPGFGESIPDITLASEDLIGKVHNWRVLEMENGSDHQYISFAVQNHTQRSTDTRPIRWDLNRLDTELFTKTIKEEASLIPEELRNPGCQEEAELLAGKSMQIIQHACKISMPKKRAVNAGRATYWWTDEIAKLRKDSFKLRRTAQRAHNRKDANKKLQAYQIGKKS